MKPRTSQAKLLRFVEQDGSEITASYDPAINGGSIVFKTIRGGILPLHVPVSEIWKTVRQDWIDAMAVAASPEPEKFDPRQLPIQGVEEVPAKVPDQVLPTTSVEVVSEPVVCEVQGHDVASEESTPVFVQEPPQPSEAARPLVQPVVRPIRPIRKPDRVCSAEGQAQAQPVN
jgi:hypothetical protein